MRSAHLLLVLIVLGAPVAAHAACTGWCTTVEFRMVQSYDLWNVTFSRNDNSFFVEEAYRQNRFPSNDLIHETRTEGTPVPHERTLVNAIVRCARDFARENRRNVNRRWAELLASAGTTNDCSSGCECAEGSFIEETDNLTTVSSEAVEHIWENDRRTRGYTVIWESSANINYVKRTKTVACIALEP